MRSDKIKAFALRKSGKSYREIRDQLKIPLGTLSGWFRDVDWSGTVRARLTEAAKMKSTARIVELGRIRGAHLSRVYDEAKEEARRELEVLKYNPLFISGVMLYWGEGDKPTKNRLRLANSDPVMINLYVKFLRQACRIPDAKIKASVLIYPDIDESSNRRFWSFASGIPLENFTKSITIQGKHKTKRLTHGVCNITVSSAYFKVKMLEWLTLLPKQLMDKQYYENI